jgi:hypothetical protein
VVTEPAPEVTRPAHITPVMVSNPPASANFTVLDGSAEARPPGWQPHQIVSRIDGWIVNPENETRIPAAVAEMIARAMPQRGATPSL